MCLPSWLTTNPPSRWTIRAVLLTVLVIGLVALGNSFVSARADGQPPHPAPDETATPLPNGSTPTGSPSTTPPRDVSIEPAVNGSGVHATAVPPGAEVTVVATQGFLISDEEAELVAFTRTGRVVYYDDTHQVYFDVDPVPGTRYTVEYVASEQHHGDDCAAFESSWCTRNFVERVNISTGAVEEVWSTWTPEIHATRYHDVDRLDETHLVVADIHEDRVFVVDTRDDEVEWSWDADETYSRDQGGEEDDWTHVNDVELLDDGRIMVSVRNMDEVVFLEPGEGVQSSWTLGTDDDHSVLYEQHNPDYLPERCGGPAVLVADSENNRIVEYHRTDGGWRSGWRWRDVRLQWPRDADRLPDGDTLVVDSHGDRVLEVSPDGEVVWSAHVGMPYDAERLASGDESACGDAIPRRSDGAVVAGGDPSAVLLDARLVLLLKDLLPSVWINGLLYVSPSWVRFTDLLVAAGMVGTLLGWGAVEYRWSSLSVRSSVAPVWRWLLGEVT